MLSKLGHSSVSQFFVVSSKLQDGFCSNLGAVSEVYSFSSAGLSEGSCFSSSSILSENTLKMILNINIKLVS
jgi:hypothetical protein